MANRSSNGSNSGYELPPFELVQILHGPVFGAGTSAAAGPSLGGAGSPSAPGGGGGGGALSPPAAGSAAAAAAAASLSPPTLSGRLSQLVIKHQQRSPATAAAASSPSPAAAGLSSAAEIATPEVSTSLSPDGRAAPSSSSRKPQTARYAESGGDTVWVAGNEGSVAVWKLDPSRRTRARRDNGKGKARETGDGVFDADGPEEVRLFQRPASSESATSLTPSRG